MGARSLLTKQATRDSSLAGLSHFIEMTAATNQQGPGASSPLLGQGTVAKYSLSQHVCLPRGSL